MTNDGVSIDIMGEVLDGEVDKLINTRAKLVIEKEVKKQIHEKLGSEEIQLALRIDPSALQIIKEKDTPSMILTKISKVISNMNIRDLTEKEISLNARKIMTFIMETLEEGNLDPKTRIMMATKFLDNLSNLKSRFYPATQKNINLNVNAFKDKLDDWRKAREEIFVLEGEAINEQKKKSKNK